MKQAIKINIIDPASGGLPSGDLPQDGLLQDGLLQSDLPQLGAIGNWLTDHPMLLIALCLLLVAGIVRAVGSKILRDKQSLIRSSLFMLPLLILVPLTFLTLSPIPSQTANAAAIISPSVADLNINIVKDADTTVAVTGTTTATATVTTANTAGYLLTAAVDATTLQTLTDNFIALTLTGGSASDLTFTVANQPEQLLFTSAAASSGETTNFTVSISVPSSITAGEYVLDITFDAADNAAVLPISMQDPTLATYCANNMSIYPDTSNGPNTITIVDTRNSQSYRVRKLATAWDTANTQPNTTTGGKCWMVDNLKLELTDSTILKPADSDVASDTPVTLATGGRTGNFTTSGYNSSDNSYVVLSNLDAWRQNDPTNIGGSHPEYGYLYNWYTATAGSLPQTSSVAYAVAPGSICPAGWKLPSGRLAATGTASDWQTLDVSYGGTGGSQSSFPTVYANLWIPSTGAFLSIFSGLYSGTAFSSTGNGSYWWSSTPAADYNVFVTTTNYLGSVNLGVNNVKASGFSVRCVLR